MPDIDTLWERIRAHAGETFRLKLGKEFTYHISGNIIITDHTHWQIPRSEIAKAIPLMPLTKTSEVQHLSGPSYIFAILTDPRICGPQAMPAAPARESVRESAPPPPVTKSESLSEPEAEADRRKMILGLSFSLVAILHPERDRDGRVVLCRPHTDYEHAQTSRLHAYGQGPFCRFRIPDRYTRPGVYALVMREQIHYIGRCDNLSQRFNMGYGQIFPRACYEGGQSTNCRINQLVLKSAQQGSQIELWFYGMENPDPVETVLIHALQPAWNSRGVMK